MEHTGLKLKQLLDEALVLKDFGAYAKLVADAYQARPVKDPAVAASYHALLPHIYRMYKRILNEVEVKFVDYDPYKSEDDMFANVHMKKVLLVTTLNNNHNPYWSPGDNLIFRAVHDYVIHRGGFHPFTLRGEIGAYNRHVKLAPLAARAALFSEVVGQVAVAEVTGSFPNPQKACWLYGFDFDQIGKVDEDEYKKNFSVSEAYDNPDTARKKALIDKGLCMQCKSPSNGEGVFCKECKEVKRKKTEFRRADRIKQGLCPRCDSKNDRDTICSSCLDKQNMYSRALKGRAKDQGICTRCNKRPAEVGTKCQECSDERKTKIIPPEDRRTAREAKKAKAEKQGRCSRCFIRKPRKDGKTCKTCYQNMRDYEALVKEREKRGDVKDELDLDAMSEAEVNKDDVYLRVTAGEAYEAIATDYGVNAKFIEMLYKKAVTVRRQHGAKLGVPVVSNKSVQNTLNKMDLGDIAAVAAAFLEGEGFQKIVTRFETIPSSAIKHIEKMIPVCVARSNYRTMADYLSQYAKEPYSLAGRLRWEKVPSKERIVREFFSRVINQTSTLTGLIRFPEK